MKNSTAIVFAVLVIGALMQSSLAAAQSSSEVALVLNKQTPYPVEPGGIVNVEVAFQNNGSTSGSITLEVVPSEPFTLLPGEDSVKTFARIDALKSVTETYKFKVSESAVSSNYDLEFRYYPPNNPDSYITKNMPIVVQGTPKIVIKDITTEPSRVQPGDEVRVSVTLLNEGSGKASHAQASLDAEADAVTGEKLIFPALSGGFYYIGDFGPGEEKTAEFTLRVDNDAEYKTYMSSLDIEYTTESGEDGSVQYDVGLPIEGRPILEVLNSEIERNEFKVEMNNIGTASAKGIKIALVQKGENRGVSVVSEIKAGKYKAVRFADYEAGAGILNISYYDESNVLHTKSLDVYIERPNEGSESGVSPLAVYGLLVLAAAEGYYIWRLRKKLRRK